MDRREHARQLRDVARKHLDDALNVAERLYATADEMDPPPRTIATTRATMCTCDVCGDQVVGIRWIGDQCESSKPNGCRCTGHYRLDPEPGLCDKCDDPVHPQTKALNGGMCAACHPFEVDPDEELTTKGGQSLGVTRDVLAFEAAMIRFLCEDPDNDEITDEWLDIASTYRGRAR